MIDIFNDEHSGKVIDYILNIKALLNIYNKIKEINNKAMWSLSSCKPDHGIRQLLDESLDTFWQSDGQQPHYVNIEFNHKTTICDICLYVNFKIDESYTPSK